MSNNIKRYLNSGAHLPDFMKDFHDQKALFKAIYTQFNTGGNKTKVLDDVPWVDAHIFTIDCFLWWMALNGYKLQKIRSKEISFSDPEESINEILK